MKESWLVMQGQRVLSKHVRQPTAEWMATVYRAQLESTQPIKVKHFEQYVEEGGLR